ncbi:MAG: hypothetical protein HY906_06750 [Deltaproteobacteria bacterium]|nr:hypothetical protein [Deltaproteobacteria bacterium]
MALLLAVTPAAAQQGAKAEARKHFQRALELVEEGALADAAEDAYVYGEG